MVKYVYNPFTHNLDATGTSGSAADSILTINSTGPDISGNFLLTEENGINIGTETNGATIANTRDVSNYVVDSQGNAGYTTIQDAIDQAVLDGVSATTPATIWIWPGTYNEGVQLTLYPFVNLASASPGVNSETDVQSTVNLTGVNITSPSVLNSTGTADNFSATNINFVPTTGTAFTLSQSNAAGKIDVFLNSCNLAPVAGSCAVASCTSSGLYPRIYFDSCSIACPVGDYAPYTFVNTGLILQNCKSYNRGNLYSTVDGGGNLSRFRIYNTFIYDTFQLSDTVYAICSNSFLASYPGYPLFDIDNIGFLYIYNCSIYDGALWVTGNSDFSYGAVTFINETPTSIDSNLTVTRSPMLSGNISFDDGVGYLNTATQGTNHQVLLGTGTSAIDVVSGTGTSGQVLTSNGTGADPTWEDPTNIISYAISSISDTDSPYTVDATTYNYISVDCSAGAVSVLLPNAPASGTNIVVKDASGDSNSNNITVTTVSGSVNIDSGTSYLIQTNYGSAQFVYNSGHYEVI